MMFSYLLVDFVFEFLRLWIISKLFIGVIYWHFINNKETKKRDNGNHFRTKPVNGLRVKTYLLNREKQIGIPLMNE